MEQICRVEEGGNYTVKPLLETEAQDRWMDGWREQRRRRKEGSVVEACANNGGCRSIFEADHKRQSISSTEVVERK